MVMPGSVDNSSVEQGAITGAASGAGAGTMIAPGVGTAIGAGLGLALGLGGSYLGNRAAKKAAKAKQAALDRYRARRRALAMALSDNYWNQGKAQQSGLSDQLQALGDGSALAKVQGDIPDITLAAPATPANMDPAQAAAYAKAASLAVPQYNANLAVDTAGRRRARFAKLLDNQAWKSNAGARFRSPEFSRARFLNAMDAAQADADFEREYGDVPNSARNQALLSSLMLGLAPTATQLAARA